MLLLHGKSVYLKITKFATAKLRKVKNSY